MRSVGPEVFGQGDEAVADDRRICREGGERVSVVLTVGSVDGQARAARMAVLMGVGAMPRSSAKGSAMRGQTRKTPAARRWTSGFAVGGEGAAAACVRQVVPEGDPVRDGLRWDTAGVGLGREEHAGFRRACGRGRVELARRCWWAPASGSGSKCRHKVASEDSVGVGCALEGRGVLHKDDDRDGGAGAFADAPAVLGLGEARQDEGPAALAGGSFRASRSEWPAAVDPPCRDGRRRRRRWRGSRWPRSRRRAAT